MKGIVSGDYINVYNENVDIFIILSEPNSRPTIDEIELIKTLVYDNYLDTDPINTEDLEQDIGQLALECTKFGFQVIVEDMYDV